MTRLRILTGIIAVLLTGVLAEADTVPYVVVMKFLPESPSAGPAWIGAALSTSLSWRLSQLPGISVVPWKSCSDLFDEDALPWPQNAYSERELTDLSRRAEADCLIAGRYRLTSGVIKLNIRVLWGGTVKDHVLDLPADRPETTDGQAVQMVARSLLPHIERAKLEQIGRPVVGSARSFEYLGRVTQSYWSKDTEQARKQADQWLKIDPNSALAEYRMAGVCEDRRQRIKHSRRTVELAPDHPLTWELLAMESDDRNESRRAIERSIALNPDNVRPHVTLAGLIKPHEKHAGARVYNEIHTARLLAHNAIDCNVVARWLFRDGRWRDAVKTLKSSLKPGVPQCRTLRYLGAIYYRGSDYPHAMQTWELVLRVRPNDSPLLTNFALAMARLRRFDDANRYIERAVRIAPRDPQVWYFRGWISYTQGDFATAEKYVVKSVELDPEDMKAHQLLQRIYMDEHKTLSALQESIIASDMRGAIWAVLIAVCAVYLLVLLFIAISVRRALRPDGPREREQGAGNSWDGLG